MEKSFIAMLILGILVAVVAICMLATYVKISGERKKFSDCLKEAMEVCLGCMHEGIENNCPNSLSEECKEMLDEKNEYISDCEKYFR